VPFLAPKAPYPPSPPQNLEKGVFFTILGVSKQYIVREFVDKPSI
jgi:hypothetical protein